MLRALALLAVLLAAPLAAQEPAALSGRVLDARTGEPVADAQVLAPGTSSPLAMTDAAGLWRAVTALRVLRVRRPGFRVQEFTARETAENVVELTPVAVPLDALVVTASRREQRLADAVPETRLITRGDVAATGASDLATVLSVAGNAQPEGGVPAGTGVLLQGLGAQRVLILVDGQPLAGRINGNLDLSRIPASTIERIEIVRGSQSTLYGSDAMGGVVNVVTRAPQAGDLSVTAAGGSQARREAGVAGALSLGALGLRADAGLRSEALAPGIEGDDGTLARRWHVAPRLQWRARDGLLVDGSALVVGERQRYRTGQLFHFGDNTQVALRAGATWQRGAHRLAPVVSWSRFDHLSRAATQDQPASDSGQRDLQDLLQAEIGYSGPLPGGILDAGIVARREAITADRVAGASRSSGTLELFAQGTWTAGIVSIAPGVRLARHARWGSVVIPRLSLLARPVPSLGIRAAIGSGFRAPDFKELYLDFVNSAAGYAVEGNPDLRPERSLNASVGVELSGDRAYAMAGAWTNRLRNFIDFGAPDAGGTYTYGNIGRGVTRGIDLEGGWTPGAMRVEWRYAFLDAFEVPGGAPMLGRARHTASLKLGMSGRRADVSAMLRYTGRAPSQRDDATGLVTAWRGDAWTLDLRGAAPLGPSLRLSAGIDNVLGDRPDGTWPGFVGRRAFAGAAWHPTR